MWLQRLESFINPRHACAASSRSVCVFVCVRVCVQAAYLQLTQLLDILADIVAILLATEIIWHFSYNGFVSSAKNREIFSVLEAVFFQEFESHI